MGNFRICQLQDWIFWNLLTSCLLKNNLLHSSLKIDLPKISFKILRFYFSFLWDWTCTTELHLTSKALNLSVMANEVGSRQNFASGEQMVLTKIAELWNAGTLPPALWRRLADFLFEGHKEVLAKLLGNIHFQICPHKELEPFIVNGLWCGRQ